MLKFGVTLNYYGHPPNPRRSPGYPHYRPNSIGVLNRFRKSPIGRGYTCKLLPQMARGWTPRETLGQKRNRRRTMSVDKRHISALRRVNLNIDSQDCYPGVVPSVVHLEAEIIRFRRLRPGTPAIVCRRAADDAFSLLYIHPDTCSVLATDFPSADLAFTCDITMSHLVLPVGWLAIPSFYPLFVESVALHHANIGPIAMNGLRDVTSDNLPFPTIRRLSNIG